MSGQTPHDEPSNRPAAAATHLPKAAVHLFPGCDPRGVMSRALAADAPPWSTRPDALVFGWMLALAPGIDSRRAAQAVITAVQSDPARTFSDDQSRLLAALADMTLDPAAH